MQMIETRKQKKRVRAYFEQNDDWQGNLYTDRPDWFAHAVVRRKQYVFQMLKKFLDVEAGPALDIGCGCCIYIEGLRSMNIETYGIDTSPTMLEKCKRHLHLNDLEFEKHFYRADVDQIPFGDKYFHIVLCIG